MELEKIFNDLESNQTHECEEAKRKLAEYFSQCKGQWPVDAMMDYFLKTGSLRIGEVLIKLQAHDTVIFDRLSDWLKQPTYRLPAINFFSFVVRRHPTWLHKVEKHRLIKEIFKLLQTEKEIVPLISALLCIITLLPIIPNAVPNFLGDLFDIFAHLASWNCENSTRLSGYKLVHLQLGLQMFFQRLYGMFPNNFLTYLTDFIKKDPKGAIYHHTIKPLLETVRIHPLLLTANSTTEKSSMRWRDMEPHDVVFECASVTLPVFHQEFHLESTKKLLTINEHLFPEPCISGLPPLQTAMHSNQEICERNRTLVKSAADITRTENKRQKNWEDNISINKRAIWSPNDEFLANTTPMPLTPIGYMLPMSTSNAGNSSHQLIGLTGSSPPEAAVEATPETTPLKDIYKSTKSMSCSGGQTGITNNPNAVRAIFASSQPSSPMRKDQSLFNFPEMLVTDVAAMEVSSNFTPSAITVPMLVEQETTTTTTTRTLSARFATNYQLEAQAMAATRRGTLAPNETSYKYDTIDMDADSLTTKLEDLNVLRTRTHTPMQTPTPLDGIPKACLECNESNRSTCTAGGLHMPIDRTMKMLLTGINRRNRMVSCSYNERGNTGDYKRINENDAINGKCKIRRTKSLSSICSNMHVSIAYDEIKSNKQQERRLQKSSKMLAIATASKTARINDTREYSNASCQTIESIAMPNYEYLLYKMLCDVRNFHHESTTNNPQKIFDNFIKESFTQKNDQKQDQDQFPLLYLQLQYERYRREIHAERNRRLMGRNRTIGSLEMERDRLKEQLKTFSINYDNSIKQNDAAIKSANERAQCLNEELIVLKTQLRNEVEQNKSLREAKENLQKQLNEQLKSQKENNYELEAMRGQIFNLTTELEQAHLQIYVGNQCKQELARLEAEFIIMGEIQVKCRDQLMELENLRVREDEMQKLREAYHAELRECKHKLDDKMSQFDSAKNKINEMQAQLTNYEKEKTDLKRLLRTVKDEYEERFKALNKKYENQKTILMQMEEKFAMQQRPTLLTAQSAYSPDAERADVASSVDRNSPLSTSLASSESLSTSLRSTELRNLQQLAEANNTTSTAIMAKDTEYLNTVLDFDAPSTSNSTVAAASTSTQPKR